MICLAVTFIVKQGHEAEAIGYFQSATIETIKEPGCLMYLAHRSIDDPTRFFLYEQYRDRESLEFHRSSAHFDKYIKGGLFNIIVSRTPELYLPLEEGS